MKKIVIGLMMMPAMPGLLTAQWPGACAYGAPGLGRDYGFGGGIVMWLITVALLGVLVFFGARLLKTGNAPGNGSLKILKERYARGEITREKYFSMKKDLA